MNYSEKIKKTNHETDKILEDNFIRDTFNSENFSGDGKIQSIRSDSVDFIVDAIRNDLKRENRIEGITNIDTIIQKLDYKNSLIDNKKKYNTYDDDRKNNNSSSSSSSSCSCISSNMISHPSHGHGHSNHSSSSSNNINDNNCDNNNNNDNYNDNDNDKTIRSASIDSIIQSIRDELKNDRNIRSYSIDSNLEEMTNSKLDRSPENLLTTSYHKNFNHSCSSLYSNPYYSRSSSSISSPDHHEQFIPQYEIFTPIDPSKPIYCEYCLKGISGKFFGFRNKYYHPQHFLCHGCRGPLPLGIKKYYRKDRPYCDDCYNRITGKICGYCNEMITEMEYIVAFGKKWHIDHVYCAVCKRAIGNEGANMFRGKFYCDQDIEKISENRCDKCQQPIFLGEPEVNALDRIWHTKCFTCDICNKLLDSKDFQSIDNIPYCSYHMEVASHCDYCKKSFIQKFGPKFTRRVRIGDKFYHINHVFCSTCQNPISKLVLTAGGGKDKTISDLYHITEDNHVLCKNCFTDIVK